MSQPTPVLSGFAFTESPRWREDRLWFSDFYQDQVFSATEDGSDIRVEATVDQQPSGLGWLPDGRMLIVSMRDARILRREPDGKLSVHADLGGRMQGHANDMVVDADGRAWVGSFGFDLMGGAPLAPAALYRVDPDGGVTEAATDLWFPNGMVITPDRVLLVNETFGNRVTAFDIGEDGQLRNRRVWAEFGDLPTEREFAGLVTQLVVSGDGACLDAEGGLWIADAIGARLLRVTEGGTVTDEIRPGTNVYACALGGAQRRTLFACTAPDFFEEARRPVREAAIMALPVTVPGL
ncbi:SMP-30/gluconolactonase/LRE family protein [Streptomyces sp. NPDC059639]|uniref:SMP-30/gluconolactonase/LRE family protein n=1 Tax=Streptomyces sp. NPDC059639 TaxID=3346891 RepID=UPI0036D0F185